jgi:diadenosine tetraphosphate (Ap4A) HIT family hydrolase
MAMPVKHELTPEERFCLEGCRSYKQYALMRKNFERKICALCDLDRDLNKVIWENELVICWVVPESLMREGLCHHSIIIPKRHVRFETELSYAEVMAIHDAKKILASSFDIPGGIVAVRIGDMSLNAGTVPHLHYNTTVPDGTGEVRVPVFKDPKDRAKNQERAEEFAKRYEAGEVPD